MKLENWSSQLTNFLDSYDNRIFCAFALYLALTDEKSFTLSNHIYQLLLFFCCSTFIKSVSIKQSKVKKTVEKTPVNLRKLNWKSYFNIQWKVSRTVRTTNEVEKIDQEKYHILHTVNFSTCFIKQQFRKLMILLMYVIFQSFQNTIIYILHYKK